MKFKNIFKKSEKTVAKANVQKVEKAQLEKIIGGVDVSLSNVASNTRSSGHANEKLD